MPPAVVLQAANARCPVCFKVVFFVVVFLIRQIKWSCVSSSGPRWEHWIRTAARGQQRGLDLHLSLRWSPHLVRQSVCRSRIVCDSSYISVWWAHICHGPWSICHREGEAIRPRSKGSQVVLQCASDWPQHLSHHAPSFILMLSPVSCQITRYLIKCERLSDNSFTHLTSQSEFKTAMNYWNHGLVIYDQC